MLKGLEAIVAELEQRVRAREFRYSDSALRASLFYLLAVGVAKRNEIARATGLSRQNLRTLVQKGTEGGRIHPKTPSNPPSTLTAKRPPQRLTSRSSA